MGRDAHKRMRDPRFRRQQERETYAPHVRAVNEFVDELRAEPGRGWVPYIAPWHGGTEARVLSVLSDPGKKTRRKGGSGFLCIENDDESAKRQAELFAKVGVSPRDITPWNAYPWYIDATPTSEQLLLGIPPLLRLIALMPNLRVVLLQGNTAQDSWDRLVTQEPRLVRERGLVVVPTYHPSPKAMWHPDPAERQRREEDRRAKYGEVSDALRTAGDAVGGHDAADASAEAEAGWTRLRRVRDAAAERLRDAPGTLTKAAVPAAGAAIALAAAALVRRGRR
ncbi:uracil-DNA glycosylase [Cryptosporangium aurantiacum]|uniref:Uracil DNA glycosylase superfamily protein n=1 Tax=Cryptosporangium aurantiacum TaxID=134849 RepID=A0A1M7PB92_9ACTN|nr:uracil-DNA glycosylase [Cryptosporangium aurantiacum]SHN14149.1 Uracil DNA glycosylase superfamily protein [Cryptosporangium aurantiacum]